MNEKQPLIVGLRFSRVGKVYHFDASGVPGVKNGDSVIVETSRGWQLGQIAMIVANPPPPPDGSWKKVDRLATARDLMLRQSWQKRESDVVTAGKQRVRELSLEGIKVITAEYAFDGSRLMIMFSS